MSVCIGFYAKPDWYGRVGIVLDFWLVFKYSTCVAKKVLALALTTN